MTEVTVSAVGESFCHGRCLVCDQRDTCIVLAGQLLCGSCDSLGRIAAAKQAYQVEKHRQGVMQGYHGRGIFVEDTK